MTLHGVAGLGLDHHRHFVEPGVVEQAGEGVEADLALADVRVAVAAGGEGTDGVVEVQGADGGQAEELFDLGEEVFVASAFVDRVAGPLPAG